MLGAGGKGLTKPWSVSVHPDPRVQAVAPIDGMPLGIKDIIETADMPTEQGSPLFVGWRTGRDAASVAALRETGAVILGYRRTFQPRRSNRSA
jgi:hypothetical protein